MPLADLFNKASNGTAPVPTTLASQKSVGAASLSLSAATGWPTTTAVHFVLYKVDTASVLVPGTLTIWKGTLSGTTVSNLTLKSGTDIVYPAGSVAEMMPTSAWADDFITGLLVQHNQDGTHAAVTASGLTVSGGSVTLPSASISQAALPLGAVVQVVNTMSSAVSTGTTIIPYDNTIPQNTEGDQYMTLAITPKATTNILVIQAVVLLSNTVTAHLIAALFQDSTANALAASSQYGHVGTDPQTCVLTHAMAAGTISATTFKIRGGGNNAGTTTFNGTNGVGLYGAITKSSLVITEYKA